MSGSKEPDVLISAVFCGIAGIAGGIVAILFFEVVN
jgi:zinc transporter ZupT